MAQKILLAVDKEYLEEYFYSNLPEYEFASKTALNRGMVLQIMKIERIDILIIREQLSSSLDANGKTISFMSLIDTIRKNYSDCRIIIMCGEHEIGDKYLNAWISRGIFDIVMGKDIQVQNIVDKVRKPSTYEDVQYLQKLEVLEDSRVGEVKVYSNTIGSKGEVSKGSSLFKPEPQLSIQQQMVQQQPSIQQQVPTQQQSFVQQQAPVQQQAFQQQHQSNTQTGFSGYSANTGYENQIQYQVQVPCYTGIIFNLSQKSDYSVAKNYDTGILTSEQTQMVPYNANKLLSSVDNPWNKKSGKVIAITSARDGAGCTTHSISIATALSERGNRVLLVDATYGHSCIYEKLGLPYEGVSFVDKMNQIKGNFTSVKFINRRDIIMKNPDVARHKVLPEELYFTKMPDECNCRELDRNLTRTTLNDLTSEFDYVVVDTSLKNYDDFTITILDVAATVCVVCLQDVYEINYTIDGLELFKNKVSFDNKLLVLGNRFVKGLPDKNAMAEQFKTSDIFVFPSDEKNCLKASSSGVPYFTIVKNKVKDIYRGICEKI